MKCERITGFQFIYFIILPLQPFKQIALLISNHMKKTALLFMFLINAAAVFAQQPADTSWKNGGFVGINFSQVSLNQWAQGGENSISFAGSLNVFANYAKGI